MADNRGAGWRGHYGWGEDNGARGMYGEERYRSEMWRPTDRDYDDREVLQGSYREGGLLQGGRGGRRGRETADYGRGYGVEWADDGDYERAARRYQSGASYGDRSYDYGPYTPYGRRSQADERPAGAYRGQDYGHDQGRRPGESRSFAGHNEYVEAVTDGDSSPGEHRGRGPKGYRRSDDRIREDINDRLTDDAWLDASNIEVSVSDCEVTLSGTVDSRQAKRRAEDIAERVSGVEDVQNSIRVNKRDEINDQTAASSAIGTSV